MEECQGWCLTGSMSFCSSKPRVASQHCSPWKMDKATKDLMKSLGSRPKLPCTSDEASCLDSSPRMNLLLPDSCNKKAKKYSAFRQKTYSDVITPGASSISGVSAKSNSFSTTDLKWKKVYLWCTWCGEIQLSFQVLALHFVQRLLCRALTLTK